MEKLTIYDKKTKKILNEWKNKEVIYEKLYDCMSAKYFLKAPWITKLIQVNLYNGTRKITVYLDNNTVWEFIVKE